jgi:hypothetical protein
VKGFPLAIRARRRELRFLAGQVDGSDLRFSRTPGGDPLPHAVESWDKAGQTAALWVKLDVVKGGSRGAVLRHALGQRGRGDAGDAPVVFEAKEGFRGRLPPQRGGQHHEGGYHDATANEAHMTGVNLKPGRGWTAASARACC